MSSLIDISKFDSDAEVLMVLFNNAGVGTRGGSLRPTMSLDEAEAILFNPRTLITEIDNRELMLHFDGTDVLDCTHYEKVNHTYPGFAQEVLDRYILEKHPHTMAATA